MKELNTKVNEFLSYYGSLTNQNILRVTKLNILEWIAKKFLFINKYNNNICVVQLDQNQVTHFAKILSFFRNSKLSVILLNKKISCDFHKFLSLNNINYLTDFSTVKDDAVCVTLIGKDLDISRISCLPLQKALAIIHCYNEEDIIEETIDHLLNEGLDVCIVDNCSTDRTYHLINKKYSDNKRVHIRQSVINSSQYEWKELLAITENLTHEFSGSYSWFMHHDADEIRKSPFKGITLQQQITLASALGYNALDFTVIDFRFIDEQNILNSYEQHLNYFEFGRRSGHFKQVKAWEYSSDINLSDSGGHDAIFSNRKIYPIKCLLKHYPLRNIRQANKKVYQDRLPRFEKEKKNLGWHGQYDKFVQAPVIKFNSSKLIDIHKINFDTEYLFERISGVGIERE